MVLSGFLGAGAPFPPTRFFERVFSGSPFFWPDDFWGLDGFAGFSGLSEAFSRPGLNGFERVFALFCSVFEQFFGNAKGPPDLRPAGLFFEALVANSESRDF